MSSPSFLQSYDLAIKYALYNKFASILGIDTQSSTEEENINLGVIQFPKGVAQRISAEKRGQTYLEFINFWRTSASFSWERNRTPVSRRGMHLAISGDDTVHVKAVPIDLNYSAWFWSKDLDKIYQVIEEYVFWQQDNPNVTLLYNDTYELTPDLHFGEIVDESTVDEQYEEGLIYVFRMPIKLDAWVLKGLSYKTVYKIRITIRDKDEITDYEEIMIEDSDQDTELEAALRFSRTGIYNIEEINLVSNSIGILGDFAEDFAVDQKIFIADSSDNNNIYTVVSASIVGDQTVVVVSEALVSAVADGIVSVNFK